MEQEFTVLENKTIGRNLYKYRMLRDVKASEIAEHIGISESQYTKYERGDAKITIDVIQKASEVLKMDPLQLIATNPDNIVENIHGSPSAGVGNYVGGDINMADAKQTALIAKLIESTIAMNEKIMALLEKK